MATALITCGRPPARGPRWVGRLMLLGLLGWLTAATAAEEAGADGVPVPTPTPVAAPAPAADAGFGDPGSTAGGSELLQFEEFPTVVSATRQASGSNVASVPVTVITDKEIHRRGAMNVPQLFEFVPGMDVIRVDRNRSALGIRGMFGSINDRILCLVDGAKTADVTTGSTNFQSFPVFLEDIKQVEVVRGPSGAAWGANAFYGVINVLTKDPAETLGFMASSTVNQYGDTNTHLRYGGKAGEARWRVSAGYEQHVSSAVALDDGGVNQDGGFTASTDSRLVVEPDSKVKITFGISVLHQELDNPSILGYRPTLDQRRDMARAFMRADMEINENLTSNWTAYYNYTDSRYPSAWSSMDRETGLESQFDYTGLDNHKIAFGGSLRYARAQAFRFGAQDWQFIDNPNEEAWAGLFLVDRYEINSHAWVELQARGDTFKFSQSMQHADWSGRTAFVYGLDDSLNHVFRISGAKSYRAATILLRATDVHRILLPTPPFPPNTYALNITPGEGMNTETIYSAEAGYTGRFNSNWTVQINAYYQRYLKLISAEQTGSLGPARFFTLDNVDGANGYGGEVEVEYHVKNLQMKAWYAYSQFYAEHRHTLLRATPPSPNKAGVTLDWTFHPDWSAFLGYRYNDQTPGDSGNAQSARVFHQMDVTMTYRIKPLHAEFLIGVTDLFNDTQLGYDDVGNVGTPESTPGRTFMARGQVDF